MLLTHFYISSLPHNINLHMTTPINLNETAVEQNFILQKTSRLSVNDIISLSPDAVSTDPVSMQNSITCDFHSRSEQREWQKCTLPLFIYSSYVTIPFLHAMHNCNHD